MVAEPGGQRCPEEGLLSASGVDLARHASIDRTDEGENVAPRSLRWPSLTSSAAISRRERPSFSSRFAAAIIAAIFLPSSESSPLLSSQLLRLSTLQPVLRRLRSRAPRSLATVMALSNCATAPRICRIEHSGGRVIDKLIGRVGG